MPALGVNIDHVATIRQARRTIEPDPVWAAALAELPLEPEALARVGKAAQGTRRDLFARVEELTLLESAANSLRVRFTLPAGSYATELIRELTGAEWLSARTNRG